MIFLALVACKQEGEQKSLAKVKPDALSIAHTDEVIKKRLGFRCFSELVFVDLGLGLVALPKNNWWRFPPRHAINPLADDTASGER